jgi:hypothetical protein
MTTLQENMSLLAAQSLLEVGKTVTKSKFTGGLRLPLNHSLVSFVTAKNNKDGFTGDPDRH